MPHVAFKCPAAGMPDEVPIAMCLKHAKDDLWRDCNWNEALLAMMVEKPDNRISPTRLMQCPREVALKRRVDYTLDPARSWFMVRGTIFHSGLENLFGENNEAELTRELGIGLPHTRMAPIGEPRVDVVRISGRLDRADGGAVVDWKSKKYIRKDYTPPEEHIIQLSVYGWLAQPTLGTLEYGELMTFDMGQVRRFVVKLRPPEWVEAWLQEKVPILLAAYDETTPLAAPLENRDAKGKEQNWRCRNCPVLRQCRGAS